MAVKKSYFLALVPPAAPAAEITRVKEVFFETYDSGHALKTAPHITLVPPFWAATATEDALLGKIPDFAIRYPILPIRLDGFGSFDRPGYPVIFIRVIPDGPLLSLQRQLLRFMEWEIPDAPIETERSFHPHITIAHRDLSEAAYQKSNAVYRNKPFHAIFEADGITLFRHSGLAWEPIRQAPFSPEKK